MKADNLKSSKWTLNDLQWLTGCWCGDALGGYCEEVWLKPNGKTMAAVFRLVSDDKTSVLEFVTIEETSTGLTYRFKHYNAALESWEEKALVFKLVDLQNSRAVFEAPERTANTPRRLIYHLKSDDKLLITVEGWDVKDGEVEAFELLLNRTQF